jgi:hypothetical protein
MHRALATIHPGYARYASRQRMDRLFARLGQQVRGPVTDTALYLRIARALAQVRCSHTKAEPPEAIASWRASHPSHLPFRVAVVGDNLMVEAGDPAQGGPQRGARLLSLAGEEAGALIRHCAALAAADGATDGARRYQVGDDSDLIGSGLDQYRPFLSGFVPDLEVRWQDRPGGPVTARRLAPISFQAWQALPSSGGPYRSDFGAQTRWEMAAPGVGLLTVPTFVNYRRPVDAAALYARALGELTAQGMTRLVVDLRSNGGGSDDAALALVDALAAGPYIWQRTISLRRPRYGDLPDHIQTWGDREAIFTPPLENYSERAGGWFDLKPELAPGLLMPRQPAAGAFAGPVTLLVGPANQSGATMVIARLKDMGRVRLLGEETGGSAEGCTAGRVFALKLPASGITVRIPQLWNRLAISSFAPGLGVAPDQRVPMTPEALRAGRDPALERALAA